MNRIYLFFIVETAEHFRTAAVSDSDHSASDIYSSIFPAFFFRHVASTGNGNREARVRRLNLDTRPRLPSCRVNKDELIETDIHPLLGQRSNGNLF